MKTLKGITTNIKEEKLTKPMSEMQPLEVCVIMDGHYIGEIVMRSASNNTFEVFGISNPTPNFCWESCSLEVAPYKGDSITLQLK